MVSKSAASELFKAAAASCGVSGKELGQLLAFLARMPEEHLTCFPTAGDNEAIVEFVRDGYRAQGKKFHEGRFGLVAAFVPCGSRCDPSMAWRVTSRAPASVLSRCHVWLERAGQVSECAVPSLRGPATVVSPALSSCPIPFLPPCAQMQAESRRVGVKFGLRGMQVHVYALVSADRADEVPC